MQDIIKARIARAIEEKVFPGCVVGVIRKNGDRFVIPQGRFTYDADAREMTPDSIFDVASITKILPTASLAMLLIDQGRLKLEDKLTTFVPEFSNTDRDVVTIKHLLTHTLDFNFRLSAYHGKSPDAVPPEKILDIIFRSEFKSKPGTKFFYTNATSILLGLVVERIFGDPLDRLGEKYFFGPLGMTRTSFRPLAKFNKEEIVPTEVQAWRRAAAIQGEIHDESAYILNQKIIPGSAGLFSTVPDLLTFLEMLLDAGSLHGKKYFSEAAIALMFTNHLADIGEFGGLGWTLNQPQFMGKHATEKMFAKTGFTGCILMGDRERGIGMVLLSNYTYPRRKPDFDPLNVFRCNIADIVHGKDYVAGNF